MAYEFHSTLHRNSREMHQHIAEDYLSAGGSNDRATMLEFLADMNDAQLADDAIAGWGLNEHEDFNRDELVEAIKDIREDFDSHFPS